MIVIAICAEHDGEMYKDTIAMDLVDVMDSDAQSLVDLISREMIRTIKVRITKADLRANEVIAQVEEDSALGKIK